MEAPAGSGSFRLRVPAPSRVSEALERLADRERDQLPLWLPVALIAGVAAWFVLPDRSAWIAFLSGTCAAGLGLLASLGARLWARALAIFCLAAALGCGLIWVRAEAVRAPVLARAGAHNFTATVERVEPLPAREQIRVILQPDGGALPPRIRVNLPGDTPVQLSGGERVRMRAYLMPPAPAAVPGAYDFAQRAWFERLGATGRPLGEVEVLERPPDTDTSLANQRSALSAHIRSRIADPSAAGIAAALATGDQGAVPEDTAEAMRRSGLAHLLSISGLHVTAVVGAAMLLTLRLLALSPWLALRINLVLVAAAAGALAGLGYTLFTGSQVPTVRACAAAMLILIGIALGRDALTLRLVATGAVIVVLLWPESVAGPSFQLSFAAVTAIVASVEQPRVKAWLSRKDEDGPIFRLARPLLALLLTGLAVELALSPIALFHFHKAGLYGAVANIGAIPLTTFVIMPLESGALLLDTVGLGAPLWWATEQSLLFLLWIARTTAAAPGAVTTLPAMPTGAYALLVAGGLWLALWRTRLRLLGLAPILAGALWATVTPTPDLLITGDGRHLAVRGADGRLAVLRPRAGDYVRSMLAEVAGEEAIALDLDALPGAACSPDLCVANLRRGSRTWRVLATRSPHFVRWSAMIAQCRAADIVVSDRRLPDACTPRWLKADRALLQRTGGLAITLGAAPSVRTVAGQTGAHPWAPPQPVSRSRPLVL